MPTPVNLEALPRCGVCHRPIFAGSPDPTICGSCVVWAMSEMRELYKGKRGPFMSRPARVDVVGPSTFAPRRNLLRVTGAGPEAPSGASGGASSASRIDGRPDRPRLNDASPPPTLTLVFEGDDEEEA